LKARAAAPPSACSGFRCGRYYDSSTGKLLESANFQTGNDAFKQIQEERNYSVKDGELSDEMMVAVSRDMAQRIANHGGRRDLPGEGPHQARDNEVTINRGEGGGVAVGDTFNVFALGEELIDPDTKESLGREEAKVGKVKITQVNPKTSTAQIMEDTGIDKGSFPAKTAVNAIGRNQSDTTHASHASTEHPTAPVRRGHQPAGNGVAGPYETTKSRHSVLASGQFAGGSSRSHPDGRPKRNNKDAIVWGWNRGRCCVGNASTKPAQGV